MLSEANLACTDPSRRNFSPRACWWIYAFTKPVSSLSKVLFTTQLASGWLPGSAVVRVLPAQDAASLGTRDASAAGRRRNYLNSTEGRVEHQASEAIGSFATRQRARQPHHRIRSTPSNSFTTAARGCTREAARQLQTPTRAMLAAITDPLTVALGGAKQLPNQASQWQGWSGHGLGRTEDGAAVV